MEIHIRLIDDHARSSLERLSAALGNLTPLMSEIGEDLLISTRQRFVDEEAPSGANWAPLSQTTKKHKKRNADKILTQDGYLSGSLVTQPGVDYVDVGSPMIYASTHQYGAEKGEFGETSNGRPIPFGDIPARPYLGLSDDDEATIRATLNAWLRRLL